MKTFILTMVMLATGLAQAHDYHTPNYCDQETGKLCAHLGYDKLPQVGEEFKFVVDLMFPTSELEKVTNIQVELDMPSMGHGSAPVQIKRKDARHFEVTEAYFPMPGQWVILVDVLMSGKKVRIEIPLSL